MDQTLDTPNRTWVKLKMNLHGRNSNYCSWRIASRDLNDIRLHKLPRSIKDKNILMFYDARYVVSE